MRSTSNCRESVCWSWVETRAYKPTRKGSSILVSLAKDPRCVKLSKTCWFQLFYSQQKPWPIKLVSGQVQGRHQIRSGPTKEDVVPSVHEGAYPRLKSHSSPHELAMVLHAHEGRGRPGGGSCPKRHRPRGAPHLIENLSTARLLRAAPRRASHPCGAYHTYTGVPCSTRRTGQLDPVRATLSPAAM